MNETKPCRSKTCLSNSAHAKQRPAHCWRCDGRHGSCWIAQTGTASPKYRENFSNTQTWMNSHFTVHNPLLPHSTLHYLHTPHFALHLIPYSTVYLYGHWGRIYTTVAITCFTKVFYVIAFGFVGCSGLNSYPSVIFCYLTIFNTAIEDPHCW